MHVWSSTSVLSIVLSAVGGQHCVSSVLGAETLGVSRSEGEQKAGFNEGHGLSDGERPRYNPECR